MRRLERVCAHLHHVRGGDWEAESLHPSPDGGRWVAVLRSASDGARVVAKHTSGDAARAYEIMRLLHAQCANARWLRIPEPVAYVEECGVIVSAYAPGLPLAQDQSAVENAGRTLAEVHHLLRADVLPVRVAADHVCDIVRPEPQAVMDALPRARAPFARTLALLAAAPEPTASCVLHRDYHLRQLFADGDRTWVVDWDDAARGDPAFDVAYFATYIRTHLPEAEAALRVEEMRRGYASAAGEQALREMDARLPLYECFNYMRRACRRYRVRDADWESECMRMVRALEERLTTM